MLIVYYVMTILPNLMMIDQYVKMVLHFGMMIVYNVMMIMLGWYMYAIKL